jgi:hypothetical protein
VPAVVYLVVTLAWSWPLPLHLTDRFAHDPGDPLLVTYLMWWNAHAVPFTQAWWSAPFFWPFPDSLALTEHLAGLSPFTTPVQWAGGSPLLAYNLILILSTWWTLLATHGLVRRLTGDPASAACGAVAFAFAPYRTAQLAHMQLYACWGMPLCLLALHAYFDNGRRAWLLVFGVSWLLLALTNGYSLFFFPLLLAAWIGWMTPWRTHARRAAEVAGTWILFSLPLLPVLLHYYRVQTRLGLSRTRSEMIFYSADWHALLAATPNLRFWHTAEPATTEGYLFPGLTVAVLVALGAAGRMRGRAFWFCVTAALGAIWLCAGPAPDGPSLASLWHPYDWLVWLPGFSGLRVPPRFFMIAALCLAIAAGMALAFLRGRVRRPAVLTAVIFAGLFVDGAINGMPLGVPPGRLPHLDRGARVLALPYDDPAFAVRLLYQSMPDRLSLVNGYAGYIPPHADAIDWALRRRDSTVLRELRRGHPLYVLVGFTEQAPTWTAFMDAQPDTEFLGVQGSGRLYRMAAAPYAREVRPGVPTGAVTVAAGADWLTADLAKTQPVRGVELRTLGNLVRLPRDLVVQTSVDGAQWTTRFEDRPGGAVLIGALQWPRVMPIRVDLGDVDARYVRVNAPAFGAGAITVYGP